MPPAGRITPLAVTSRSTKAAAMRAVVLACAVASVLPGCALLGSKVRECEGFDVPLSVYVGPSRKELRCRVLSSGVDETFPFVAEANAESMVIVGFTPLGTKSFTLTRKADDVEVDNVLGAGLKVAPRNVMADVLAMSLPSSCATAPDGDSPSNFDSWRVTDTCSDNRPVRRTIAKAPAKEGEAPDVEVEIEYRAEAIVVRQKQCKYTAAYVLQASQPIPGVDVKKTDDDAAEDTAAAAPASAAPAAPAVPAAPAAPPAPAETVPAAPVPAAQPAAPAAPAPAAPSPVAQPATPATPAAPAAPVSPPAPAPAPAKKPVILAPSPGGSPILIPAN
jgi:hypothetical protein